MKVATRVHSSSMADVKAAVADTKVAVADTKVAAADAKSAVSGTKSVVTTMDGVEVKTRVVKAATAEVKGRVASHLVEDEEELRKFGRFLLGHFSSDNDYCGLLFLLARRKYFAEMPKNAARLPRYTVTSQNLDDFVKLVKSIDTSRFVIDGPSMDQVDTRVQAGSQTGRTSAADEVGEDDDKDCKGKEKTIPPEALVLYCTIDPRSMYLALSRMMNEFSTLMYRRKDCRSMCKVESRLKTELHSAVAERLYLDIDVDIDKKDDEKMKKMYDFFDEEKVWPHVVMTLDTRGGYHIILALRDISRELRGKLHMFSNDVGEKSQRGGQGQDGWGQGYQVGKVVYRK